VRPGDPRTTKEHKRGGGGAQAAHTIKLGRGSGGVRYDVGFSRGAPKRARLLPVDRYVVIGNPVAHSLSPEIHARFAAAMGETLEYGRLLVAREAFAPDVLAFFDGGGRGANVTLPFKEEALDLRRSRERSRAHRGGRELPRTPRR